MWNITSQGRVRPAKALQFSSESNQTLQIFGATTAIDREVNPPLKCSKKFKSHPELKNASPTYSHENASPLVINTGPFNSDTDEKGTSSGS